jgi:hypothetical protein
MKIFFLLIERENENEKEKKIYKSFIMLSTIINSDNYEEKNSNTQLTNYIYIYIISSIPSLYLHNIFFLETNIIK